MIRHSGNTSESWKNPPWKQFRRNLFRLQKRIYKAIRVGDKRKAFISDEACSEIHRSEITGSAASNTTQRWQKDGGSRWQGFSLI